MTDTESVTQTVLRERQGLSSHSRRPPGRRECDDSPWARDRGWWDRMRACYWPDSVVNLSWYRGSGPGFVDASAHMAGRGDASVHRLSPPAVRIAPYRAPYAILACHLDRRGYPVSGELLGDDRPERAAAFYDDTLKWLAG
ncbi:hypothetical protein [Streptomyces drozdowiczii]|uniref:Nuclear transport factor 2 family protein n=1 Tax=Streptomyces drozdowiczii TaxID=202862 RepID=A0ABY6Q097_9ACTN|nr:hypothetical protein [Streptomyces drozdowiczii]MCX0242267.1 nuclear transport factor 2 family protein [Streptomyces drozdowiczii]UZK57662.1 nuclear transport factor 2 family protein [Streptomyces drozdowiczii]